MVERAVRDVLDDDLARVELALAVPAPAVPARGLVGAGVLGGGVHVLGVRVLGLLCGVHHDVRWRSRQRPADGVALAFTSRVLKYSASAIWSATK